MATRKTDDLSQSNVRKAGERVRAATADLPDGLAAAEAECRRYRDLFDALPQLVWAAGADGTVDYYNGRAAAYAGLSRGPGSHRPMLEVHPDDRGPTQEAWDRAVRTGTPYEVEHRVEMKDGGYRWHLSRGVPVFDERGRVVRWFGTATDIQRLKEAEEEARRAQQAAEAAAADVEALLAGEAAPLGPGRAQGAGGRRGRGTVLLAEDNPVNRMVVTRFLEQLGFRAHVVEDGAAAVEAALSGSYDLVLLDWQLPGMDGLEAAREIRRREGPGRRVPIVALTAHALREHREKCLAAGMDDYLTKPVEVAELERVLRRWAGDGAGRAPAAPAGFQRVERRLAELAGTLAPAIVRDIVGLFLEQAPARLAALREAVGRADAAEVARESHGLRGVCSHLCTDLLLEVAAGLEHRAEAGDLEGAGERVAELDEELARLLAYLEALGSRAAEVRLDSRTSAHYP